MRFDFSDALILVGVAAGLGALGWLFGPAVAVLVGSFVLAGFGFALHRAQRRR